LREWKAVAADARRRLSIRGDDMRARLLPVLLIAGLAVWFVPPSRADDNASAPQPSPQQENDSSAVPKESAPPPKEPAPPPSVTIIGARDAHGVLGRDVRSPTDEDMGRIVDVVVDRKNTVRAAVIDFGGFLGVGSRKIIVDWNALHFGRIANKSDSITLELTKEQVMAAPEYKEGTPMVVLGASGSLQPWQFDPQ
jgi:hypothetical protein